MSPGAAGRFGETVLLEQVVEVQQAGLYLHQKRGHLEVQFQDSRKQHLIDLDRIGLLLLSSPHATLSTSLLNVLAERRIPVVLCGKDYLPASLLLPLKPHLNLQERVRAQVEQSQPQRKRGWQAIVQAKLANQAAVLGLLPQLSWQGDAAQREQVQRDILGLAAKVRSDDEGGREAQGARLYWPQLFGPNFRRGQQQMTPNGLLNYGYTILLGSMLRSISGSGLHPAFGLHHHSSQNPYCLASDLMEGFRPFVDAMVLLLYYHWNLEEPGLKSKRALSQLLRLEWNYQGEISSLRRNCQHYVQQYVKLLTQKEKSWEQPLLGAEILTELKELCDSILTR